MSKLFMFWMWIIALASAFGLGFAFNEWLPFVVYVGLGLCVGSVKQNAKKER